MIQWGSGMSTRQDMFLPKALFAAYAVFTIIATLAALAALFLL